MSIDEFLNWIGRVYEFNKLGTTGVACLNTNRKFIGIEKDEKYFDIAKERIVGEENPSGANICLGDSSDE